MTPPPRDDLIGAVVGPPLVFFIAVSIYKDPIPAVLFALACMLRAAPRTLVALLVRLVRPVFRLTVWWWRRDSSTPANVGPSGGLPDGLHPGMVADGDRNGERWPVLPPTAPSAAHRRCIPVELPDR